MIDDELDNTLFYDNIEDVLKDKLNSQIEKGLILIKADELTENFITDLEKDIILLQTILAKWNSGNYTNDPKLEGILAKVKSSITNDKKRKIIIFSEFKDTVDYLYEKFKNENIRVMHYTSKSKGYKDEVKQNFDAGLAEEHQKDEYDVLVATDAISEGFSLHRAGTIYNYDIPYNPTRVIQRVGRINRINKKVFDKLHIYNFFPSATGEALSRTKSITTFKMLLIQTIFGSDTKILTADEITEGYLTDEYKKTKTEAEKPSWHTEYENILYRIKKHERDIFDKAIELPPRCRTGRKITNAANNIKISTELFENSVNKGVIVFSKKGDALRFTFTDETGKSEIISPQQGLISFKAEPNEKALPVTDNFYPIYERTKSQSGSSGSKLPAEKGSRSKNLQELATKINSLRAEFKKNNGSKKDIEYLDNLRKISFNLDSLPVFYIRSLLAVEINDLNLMLNEFKNIVSENYISTILNKESKIINEVETILLSEQFL
jgi:superfamily II DNA/RNA helicase